MTGSVAEGFAVVRTPGGTKGRFALCHAARGAALTHPGRANVFGV